MDRVIEVYKGIPKSKMRKTTYIIDDDEVTPSTSEVEEPILYHTPNVPLSNDTLQQLLVTIMK